PKFFAIEKQGRGLFGWGGAPTHVRGIRTGVPFRQRERGNFVSRNAGKVFLFLFVGAEKQQRLWNADRLVRGNERSQIFIPASEQHRGASVIDLRQTEPFVLLRNFHPERAHREEI